MSPRLAAELERLREQEEAREAEKARKAAQGESDSENSFDEDEPDTRQQKPKKLKSRFWECTPSQPTVGENSLILCYE